ncbi:MAG TPA: hypothetical protein VFI43_03290 [Nitrosospira sp.]|nr:hypothetical protein [Nitrosospira sp.]
MKKDTKMVHETEYDEIVRKLDALLSKHKHPSPGVTEPITPAAPFSAAPADKAEAPLAATDNIPTLTEIVQVAPAMLSPHADIRSLLYQILDSALKDTGVDLDAATRSRLVQALESQLFSL